MLEFKNKGSLFDMEATYLEQRDYEQRVLVCGPFRTNVQFLLECEGHLFVLFHNFPLFLARSFVEF